MTPWFNSAWLLLHLVVDLGIAGFADIQNTNCKVMETSTQISKEGLKGQEV
jgi:hypothetical protein